MKFENLQNIPAITVNQMREVDRLMIEEYNISLIQMMENAGLNLAELARSRFLDGDPRYKSIIVLAGTGGNGGGALVAARHLQNWGVRVRVILSKNSNAFSGIPSHQMDILERMKVTFGAGIPDNTYSNANLIIDGLIGYNIQGNPQDLVADLIRWANNQNGPVLSLDCPSGLNLNTGEPLDPVIKATATMTLALPKEGLLEDKAKNVVGNLYLADISVPPELYVKAGFWNEPKYFFLENSIHRLR